MNSNQETERRLLWRYVDFIICTDCGEQDNLLRKVNNFHKRSEITIKTSDEKCFLDLLDMNIYVNSFKDINCGTRQQLILELS